MSTVVATKGGGEAARWYSPTFMHTMTAGAWWRLLTAHGFRVRFSRLLALDDRFAFPTTLECFAPHHCLLTERLYPKLFSWLLPAKRTMDNMAVGFDRPQEDEFALAALGVPRRIGHSPTLVRQRDSRI
jgi:hypothetical protein